jgi:hypothetical protein
MEKERGRRRVRNKFEDKRQIGREKINFEESR